MKALLIMWGVGLFWGGAFMLYGYIKADISNDFEEVATAQREVMMSNIQAHIQACLEKGYKDPALGC